MPNNKDVKKENHKKNVDPAQNDPVAPVTVSKDEYDALAAKAAERDSYHEKYLRAHAEFENARKRIEKEKSDFVKFANDGIILELLPIFDNLEMAEKYIKEAKDFKAVRDGVDMIHMQLQKFLKDAGVERIKCVGEKFDPMLHDILEIDESGEKEDGIIVAELKSGYRINGRILRHALIKIAKKPADEQAAEESPGMADADIPHAGEGGTKKDGTR